MIRNLTLHDLAVLEPAAKFPMPDLSHPAFVEQRAFCQNDKLITGLFLQVTTEILMITNPAATIKEIARATVEMNTYLHNQIRSMGIGTTHIFVSNDEKFEKYLIKHFNFVPVEQKCLYLGGI